MLNDFWMIFIEDGKVGVRNYDNMVIPTVDNWKLKHLIALVDSHNSILLRNMQREIDKNV